MAQDDDHGSTGDRDGPRELPVGWVTLICLALLAGVAGLGMPTWAIAVLAVLLLFAAATDAYRWRLRRRPRSG
ncbi:hypothetical protein Ae168Ps1_2128 [Pseudonocardia sp. Ae168_Ps1]|uniref:hypothetical protein n=1 Tax=unclassified Pseudonocardia TaxID=2619320 RepID=UPI00094B07EF|nr:MULTISPECIES: hypothetical protein [unclassified Pseudonocardia]OLL73744.1 hypothetical protein Ae150APs1_2122 [Pseudonocardia sp. Ae150A_Ps1]OLL79722.1 hypothetical protein Ae168Ps1_2128 [Pseudonocardia sp. Ae168_Ps1]OLL86142.1 hypothetical protein Ae263Ps1_3197c [Pseudonocardia sp. Ae263_Ps1]OLL93827.1 hypothetical protein Ae356Ps1_3724 [Pseudonocardia sp. Ae356_Ps1]